MTDRVVLSWKVEIQIIYQWRERDLELKNIKSSILDTIVSFQNNDWRLGITPEFKINVLDELIRITVIFA